MQNLTIGDIGRNVLIQGRLEVWNRGELRREGLPIAPDDAPRDAERDTVRRDYAVKPRSACGRAAMMRLAARKNGAKSARGDLIQPFGSG